MCVKRKFLHVKLKHLGGLLTLVFISAICVAFSMNSSDDFDFARREVLLRRIGHEILLQSGDSTSRVLPVKKLAENEFQISFEQAFSFQPDSLVNTIRALLGKEQMAGDYVVNVVNCSNASVAYGFAISKNKKDDIVACIGRNQPKGCYMINIKFKPTGIASTKNRVLLGTSLITLVFIGFIILRSAKPKKTKADSSEKGTLTLGTMSLNPESRMLILNGDSIELTRTETRLLHIFALSPNELIERDRLQKEIWEDDGVIVGRSLDMFISKLRKKLKPDQNINIVVKRGKGYILEINTQ